jgi:hypothetical protein
VLPASFLKALCSQGGGRFVILPDVTQYYNQANSFIISLRCYFPARSEHHGADIVADTAGQNSSSRKASTERLALRLVFFLTVTLHIVVKSLQLYQTSWRENGAKTSQAPPAATRAASQPGCGNLDNALEGLVSWSRENGSADVHGGS